MALLYSKSELEAIAQRLQCCAAEAANEALTGEVFMDHAKKTCGWNKFKFLKKASKILSEYVPGGVNVFTEPFAVENTIDPDLSSGFILKDAAVVNDILSPYYGYSFIVFGNDSTGETYIYILYNGELKFIMDSSLYSSPYMSFVQSVTYDNASDVLVLGAYDSIQEYDLSPLLLSIPEQPLAVSSASYPGVSHQYAAYNRIENTVMFSNTAGSEVYRYYSYSNFSTSIPVSSSPTYITTNTSNGQTWVVCGTLINVINAYSPFVSFNIDLTLSLGFIVSIERITYSRELNLFIVPYFNGIDYKVALLNSDGSVYTPQIYIDYLPVPQGLYYQQLEKYLVASEFAVVDITGNSSYYLETARILLNDTKNNKLIACSNTSEFATDPLRILVISALETEELACLTDDDVQNIIETAQHHCCDCCPAPIIYLDSSSFSENPATQAEEEVVPETLYRIYYGPSIQNNLAKLDPLELLTLGFVNRYQYQGIYSYYVVNPSVETIPSYLYYAIPLSMATPTGFFDANTALPVSMQAPYYSTYNGVTYQVYKSTSTYTTNISLQVI